MRLYIPSFPVNTARHVITFGTRMLPIFEILIFTMHVHCITTVKPLYCAHHRDLENVRYEEVSDI